MKVYRSADSQFGAVFIYDDSPLVDSPMPLPPCLHVANHSPTGFAWGYAGSGPAQLALAILVDHFMPFSGSPADARKANDRALALHQQFKFAAICKRPQSEPFEMTSEEVARHVAELERWNEVNNREPSLLAQNAKRNPGEPVRVPRRKRT